MASSSHRASTSTSAPSALQWKYDVFLSFRGEDTRKGFTDHLYEKLQWRGIETFRDDPQLKRGVSISPELLIAIQQSRFAVVVLSPNYASSTWCLVELTEIFQCMEERETILPIFYDVDPSDVRHQRGSFAESFTKHERDFKEDLTKVQGWRDALTKVANLTGWTSKDRYETELIGKVVEQVWNIVLPTFTFLDSSDIVGIDSKLKEIDLLLDTEADDVRFIGIWGMGGIGKTTLARLVYERISRNFEVSSFLANIRETSATHGIVHLQKQLLSQILKDNTIQAMNVYDGITKIKNCSCHKKLLLILDDVDNLSHLQALVGHEDWFGLGSRIIITTRDERLLVEHGVENLYEAKGLDVDEAFQLFSLQAFRKDEPADDYLEMSEGFVNYAQGLPLALKTLGSSLYKRGRDAWNSSLDKLKKYPNSKIFQALKISYDGLDEMEKSVFLDVACFHKGKKKELVITVLEGCGFCASIALDVLAEKSLLTISSGIVSMHDLIQEMGWKIIRQESYEELGRYSRLWLPDDIFYVLTKNTGTQAIEAIVLSPHTRKQADWNSEVFSNMCKLRLLQIDDLRLSQGPKFLPNALRVLRWSWYPSKFLPRDFQPDELTVLSLRHSNIFNLWDGRKYLDKLKYIDLSHSKKLTRTPDFTHIQNLESLFLRGCRNLVNIHPSIASLKLLKVLNFEDCERIKSLPSKVEMQSLEVFILSGCSNVKKIPEFVGPMTNLGKLSLDRTAIENILSSMQCLTGITSLDLTACKSLLCLPSAISSLKYLKSLLVSRCSKLDNLPENFGELEFLEEIHLDGTAIKNIPSSIGCLTGLISLDLRNCKSLACLPSTICSLKSLIYLYMSGCSKVSLPSLNGLCSLRNLDLGDCNLCEGAIPDDIGCLFSLERLNLSGNNFVSLPASIKRLFKLQDFNLERCKRLQELPGLSSTSVLHVNANDCTSLKMGLDPPLPSRYTDLFDFTFRSVNCFELVDSQGRNNIIFSLLKPLAQGIHRSVFKFQIVTPGSVIPEWFNNQSVGDSLVVELPPHSSSKWMGIAICVVSADKCKPFALLEYDCYGTNNLTEGFPFKLSSSTNHLLSNHIWVRYVSSDERKRGSHIRISFGLLTSKRSKPFINMKCGARLVYAQDMEEPNQTVKQTSEHHDEARVSGSGSSFLGICCRGGSSES